MDEMTNMNETTMENETSVEVVPEENVQMIDNEETSSNGSGFGLAVGAVGLVAAVGYGLYRKHNAKKQNQDEGKCGDFERFHGDSPFYDSETKCCSR